MLDVVVTAPLNRSRVGSRLARPSRFHGTVTSMARASASQMESEKVTGRPFGTEREGRVPFLPSGGPSERARPFVTRLGRGRRKREPHCGGEQARSLRILWQALRGKTRQCTRQIEAEAAAPYRKSHLVTVVAQGKQSNRTHQIVCNRYAINFLPGQSN